MKTRIYVIMNENGTIHTRKTLPSLTVGEVSLGLDIEIPNGYFKRPRLLVQLTIPDKPSGINEEPVIDLAHVKEAIETSSGMEVKISFANREEDDAR